MMGFALFRLLPNVDHLYNDNYVLLAYLWLVVLTLPSLIAKIYFQAPYFSFTAAASYTYYPIVYLVTLAIAQLGADMQLLSTVAAAFTLLLWNALWALDVLYDPPQVFKRKLQAGAAIFITILAVGLAYLGLGRGFDSLVANDYLVHRSATVNMANGSELCIIPSQCSNLFLVDAYTTFYHSVVMQVYEGFAVDVVAAGYILDLVYPALMVLVIYKMLRKFQIKNIWAIASAASSLLIFEVGAFGLHMFLPQTFALLITLLMLNSPKLSVGRLIAIAPVILAIHAAMGLYLYIQLLLYFIFIEKYYHQKRLQEFKPQQLILPALTLTFIVAANFAGFSIERYFQQSQTDALGFLTNPYFPDNALFIYQLLGLASIGFAAAVVAYIFELKKNKFGLAALLFIAAALAAYFLGPIYANKFSLGLSIFVSAFVYMVIAQLKVSNAVKVIFSIVFMALLSYNLTLRYDEFLVFYEQNNGFASAYTSKDQGIIEAVRRGEWADSCVFVSDPQTQLMISSLGEQTSAQGHYMSLDGRDRLADFALDPTDGSLDRLLRADELDGIDNVCLVYSARLKQLAEDEDSEWLELVYSYEIDTNRELDLRLDEPIRYLEAEGYEPQYEGSYFSVFVIPTDRVSQ
jgi:hypothetical protein